ncbi:MAG: acyltransferase [Chloroflexi bacterium]|nr:acyltransferase [Chloroflexota bacterium]
MKTNLIDGLIFQWLARYETFKEARRQESLRRLSKIAPTARIDAEADIQNILGDPLAITMGENSYLRGRLITYGHGGQIHIGDWCYIGARSEIWSMNSITIGNRVLIAHDVNIHDGDAHSKDADERHRHYRHILEKGHPRSAQEMPGVKSAPIVIEDDVWISFGVTVLKGVRIGKGSVIAANSFVTHDVPPGVVYRCQITPIIEAIK